jgi:hypothetical protein
VSIPTESDASERTTYHVSRLREGNTRGNDSKFVNGTVFSPQIYVKIHWGWIALLASQLFLTTLFLVGTIAETFTARAPILKGSLLPTLCILDKESRKRLGSVNDINKLNREARSLKVTLERQGSGIVLRPGIQETEPKSSRRDRMDPADFDKKSFELQQLSSSITDNIIGVGIAM